MLTVVENIAGREVAVEYGQVANQSHGIVVRSDNTVLLCTTVIGKEVEFDGVPLSVNYLERFSAVNRIPGGYKKRELGQSDREAVVARAIDRAIRPNINVLICNDIQVTIQVLSCDNSYAIEPLAILAASISLNMSGVLSKCVAATKIADGAVNSIKKANITQQELFIAIAAHVESGSSKVADIEEFLDLEYKIVMLEYLGPELDSSILKNFLKINERNVISDLLSLEQQAAAVAIKMIKLQRKFLKSYGKIRYFKPQEPSVEINKEEFLSILKRVSIEERLSETSDFAGGFADQAPAGSSINANESDVSGRILSQFSETGEKISHKSSRHLDDWWDRQIATVNERKHIKKLLTEALINDMFATKTRLDGRKFNEIRPLSMQIKFLPMLHGSALFTRGGFASNQTSKFSQQVATQVIASVTIGNEQEYQSVEALSGNYKENFLLHYNFLPYSVYEIGGMGLGRRSIGHGELARKALLAVMPKKINQTVRVFAEVTSSNGSSSMATICASSLALFDAGILDRHVAGVSIGLIERVYRKKSQFKLITDITELEDAYTLMDFKIAGTKNSITAMQLDIKNDGITREILEEALKLAQLQIKKTLQPMYKTIAKPSVRKIVEKKSIKIDRSKIRNVIGKSGSVVNELCAEFDVKIDIENNGRINVTSQDPEKINKAIARIYEIVGK